MNVVRIADTHCGAPHEVMPYHKLLDEINIVLSEGKKVVLLGDIIDLANCKKKHVKMWTERVKHLSTMHPDVHYVRGNHECKAGMVLPMFVVLDGCLYIHGHEVFWDMEKIIEWEQKEGGKGRFARSFYTVYKVGIMGAKRKDKDPKFTSLDDDQISMCVRLMKRHGVGSICMGHKHKKCFITFNRVEDSRPYSIEVLPRGINYS